MSDELKRLIEVGYWFLRGNIEERDYDVAFQLLTKAANQGSAEACRMLAEMYHEGLGRNVDLTEAAEYYFRANWLEPVEVDDCFLCDFIDEWVDFLKNKDRSSIMRRDDVKEAIVTVAANYSIALLECFKAADIILEKKEIIVEMGGHYTSDLEELATGQWDIWTAPYKKDYKFIAYGINFGDKVIVKNREYNYSKWSGEVNRVFEKIVFAILSVPIDIDFSIELEHKMHIFNEYEDWRKDLTYTNIAIMCKGSLKIRDAVLCSFKIEAEQDEAYEAINKC